MRDNLIVDCFAGGGGASVGIEMALGRQVDIAINHDPDAILMHKTNHPDTLHLTEDIFKADLKKYVKGRHVALMWASPDCTSHSKAKGGQPRKRGLRILPWAVYKHARVLLPDVIIMENVEEIQQWGPLDENGHPIPERRGEDYKKFITAMKSLGYVFDSRELVAADYGAPTTRKRWYAIFRRDGRDIVWPVQTHGKGGAGGLKPWEPIYKHLDLWDLGKSIFGRKKPLAENTMKRIARGLEKFVFNNPQPFIMKCYGGNYKGAGTGVDEPLRTVVTRDRFALVTVLGSEYVILDIFLRMLRPEELKLGQGFPKDYVIDRDYMGHPYPASKQVARIGNSVVPIMAEKLVGANCGYLKVGKRQPIIQVKDFKAEASGQMRFA